MTEAGTAPAPSAWQLRALHLAAGWPPPSGSLLSAWQLRALRLAALCVLPPRPSAAAGSALLGPSRAPCTRAFTLSYSGTLTARMRWLFPSPTPSEGQDSPPGKDPWEGAGLATAHLGMSWAVGCEGRVIRTTLGGPDVPGL